MIDIVLISFLIRNLCIPSFGLVFRIDKINTKILELNVFTKTTFHFPPPTFYFLTKKYLVVICIQLVFIFPVKQYQTSVAAGEHY